MTPEQIKKAKKLANEELKKIVESDVLNFDQIKERIEEMRKDIIKGLEISEAEYKVADFLPAIDEMITKKYKELIPALNEIKEKLNKEFPVDYESLKNKPNLEELKYDDTVVFSKINKIIPIIKEQRIKIKEIDEKKIIVNHNELKKIGPDDHHKEKHTLESHTETALLQNLYRLVSGEEIDDLHKHKGVKVGTAQRNYGLYNPMHFHDDIYYKKSEVDALITAGAGGAPTGGHYLTDRAEAGLTAEVNLGALATGLLKGTVAGGVSTISAVTDNSANWDTAFGWGNHAGLYSLLAHNHAGVYEPADASLTSIAGLTYVSGSFIALTAADTYTVRTYAQVLSDIGAAAVAQTMYIGTTAVAINRGSAALTLAGITLTTPDIGTPSAGVLTNCSGLPATAIVAGTFGTGAYVMDTTLTVPKLIGGTATTSDLYLQTTSGAGTTGADMHFLVGNNGATEAMTILNSGNVGIGTTAPQAKLEIYGATPSIIIGDSSVNNDYAATIRLLENPTSNFQGAYVRYSGTDNNLVLGVHNTDDKLTANDIGAIVIERATGNVGIGTTGPTAYLHLKAGTATANTAPLKLTSGTLNTTPEAGTIEFLTDAFYGTITTGPTRKTFAFLESPAFTTPNIGTPSVGTLTNCTGLPLTGLVSDTTTALGIGSINLGHASDTTLSRSAAGILAVEGVVIPSISSTNTLTNKRITARVGTVASSATPTPAADDQDMFTVTALAEAATFGAPTGTPTNGQKLTIRILDNGTARALGWNAIYRAGTDVALPTTTVISKTLYCGFMYNSAGSKWDLLAVTNNI